MGHQWSDDDISGEEGYLSSPLIIPLCCPDSYKKKSSLEHAVILQDGKRVGVFPLKHESLKGYEWYLLRDTHL